MKNLDAIPAQQDPCEVCGEPLDRYELCSCIENPALCTGAPVPNEIFDHANPKWRNFALAVQGEDWHCVWPEVAIRIKWDGWDFANNCLMEESPDKPEFTYCEVSPSIALRFAWRIARVATWAWLVGAKNATQHFFLYPIFTVIKKIVWNRWLEP